MRAEEVGQLCSLTAAHIEFFPALAALKMGNAFGGKLAAFWAFDNRHIVAHVTYAAGKTMLALGTAVIINRRPSFRCACKPINDIDTRCRYDSNRDAGQ